MLIQAQHFPPFLLLLSALHTHSPPLESFLLEAWNSSSPSSCPLLSKGLEMVPQSWEYCYFPCNTMTDLCVCVSRAPNTRGSCQSCGNTRLLRLCCRLEFGKRDPSQRGTRGLWISSRGGRDSAANPQIPMAGTAGGTHHKCEGNWGEIL